MKYDVIIESSEPRYWFFLLASLLLGALFIRRFDLLNQDRRDRALRQMGYFFIVANFSLPIFSMLDPEQSLTWHRSIPLHFCGMNYILIAVNCFARNRSLFTFTAFLGTIGGLHGVLTPQLTVGDAPLVLADYYLRHTSIIIMPIIMSRSFGFRIPKFAWMWIYVVAAVLSTAIGGVNWLLNTYVPNDVIANYMYMWEAPKVDNPFVSSWPWPFYIIALHAGLVIHLVVINAIYRWTSADEAFSGQPMWKRLLT